MEMSISKEKIRFTYEDYLHLPDDIFFICKEREHIVTERNIRGAPDLVVEIVSQFTAKLDRTLKTSLYERFKVQLYRIARP